MEFKRSDFDFDQTNFLGGGSFGRVFNATRKGTSEHYALKKIPIPPFIEWVSDYSTSKVKSGDEIKRRLLAEIPSAEHNCPNIIQYYGHFPKDEELTKLCGIAASKAFSGSASVYPDEDCLFVVMELCDGNLYNFLEKLNRNQLQDIFGQILVGLEFIHRRAKIHRDIRPDNILVKVDSRGHLVAKLGDFGLSKDLSLQDNETLSNIGNVSFKSPEMRLAEERKEKTKYDSSADIYSCGLSFYKCLYVSNPEVFGVWNNGYLKEIYDTTYDFPCPSAFEQEIRLVKEMTEHEPYKRPTASQLLSKAFKKPTENGYRFELCDDWDLTTFAVEIKPDANSQRAYRDAISKCLGAERLKDLPVVIVSVNGPSRTYKSFLVANMIKYWRYCKQPNWVSKGYGSNVVWRGGISPVTRSINIWLEPFVLVSGDKEFLVLIIDTPGVTKYNSRDKKSLMNFVFPMFLSSVFIYNVKGSHGALEGVASFMETLGLLQKEKSRKLPKISEKLILLHRDWSLDQIDADTERYRCGYYDDTVTPPSQTVNWMDTMFINNEDMAIVVASSFKNVGVYAMAHPGEGAHPIPGRPSSDWETNFITNLEDFMEKIMHPDVLVRNIKQHSDGRDMRASDLVELFDQLEGIFPEM